MFNIKVEGYLEENDEDPIFMMDLLVVPLIGHELWVESESKSYIVKDITHVLKDMKASSHVVCLHLKEN